MNTNMWGIHTYSWGKTYGREHKGVIVWDTHIVGIQMCQSLDTHKVVDTNMYVIAWHPEE